MNKAESALRETVNQGGAAALGTPAASALNILNSWSTVDRESFRSAYVECDWERVYRLCKLQGRAPQFASKVFLHLMDATRPDPESAIKQDKRSGKDRRLKVTACFTPERRGKSERRRQQVIGR